MVLSTCKRTIFVRYIKQSTTNNILFTKCVQSLVRIYVKILAFKLFKEHESTHVFYIPNPETLDHNHSCSFRSHGDKCHVGHSVHTRYGNFLRMSYYHSLKVGSTRYLRRVV